MTRSCSWKTSRLRHCQDVRERERAVVRVARVPATSNGGSGMCKGCISNGTPSRCTRASRCSGLSLGVSKEMLGRYSSTPLSFHLYHLEVFLHSSLRRRSGSARPHSSKNRGVQGGIQFHCCRTWSKDGKSWRGDRSRALLAGSSKRRMFDGCRQRGTESVLGMEQHCSEGRRVIKRAKQKMWRRTYACQDG